MILSAQQLFSDDQAITATAASTNYIDLSATGTPVDGAAALVRDIGPGNPIPLLIQVTTAFGSTAEDSTLTIAIQLDSTTTFTPDASIDLGTFAEATLVAGYQIPVQYVPNDVNLRYARLYYTVAGTGDFTAGALTAGISMGNQTNT